MKRTTISVPDALLARARRIAEQRGTSLGRVFRDALQHYLDGARAWDLPASLGVADSGGTGRGRELSDLPERAYAASG